MLDHLFDPGSFSSIQLKFAVVNTTTKKELKSPSGTGAAAKRKVLLQELLDRGMILELPARFCVVGAYLVLQIDSLTPDGKKGKFKTGARVDEVVAASDDAERVTLSLIQHDQSAWDAFCSLFTSRQDEIEKFFKAARGE